MPAEQSLTVEMSCPLFDRDRIVRTFSRPFSLPLTPLNRRVLRHVDRFDATEAWGEQESQLWLGGGQYDVGELVSLGGNDDAIEVMFRNLPLTLADDLKQIYINEILEPLTVPDTGATPLVKLDITEPPSQYQLNIGVHVYVLGIGGSSGMTKQDVAEYFRDDINADFPGMASAVSNQLWLDSEMLNTDNPDWDEMLGFSFASYITPGESAMESFTNYVADVVTTPVDEVCFPLLQWANFYDGKNAAYTNKINPVFDGVGLLNEYSDDEKSWEYSYMPAVKVSYILERIREVAGISYLAGWLLDDADAQKAVVISDRSCDFVFTDFTEANRFQYLNGFESEIVLNKHVPKMTALDFLKRIADGLNLIIDYKAGGLYFTKALDLVTQPAENWSEFASAKDYSLALTKPQGAVLEYVDEAEMNDDATQLEAYTLGGGGVRFTMAFNSLFMWVQSLFGHGSFRVPSTKRVGQCPAYGQDIAKMGLHLLFYRGLGDTSTTEEYPYATHDELDADGSTVVGGLSLSLDGAYGLVEQMYGPILGYGDLSEMDITAIVPESELYRLKRWQNARVWFYHPKGSVTLVIRSVEFEVRGRDDGGWVRARVKGLKE